MTTTTLNMHRPFVGGWLDGINWRWWLTRAPMLLLALPSAYGVGAFASEYLPWYVALFAGLAFEAAYIGCIALADQQHEDTDRTTTALWWLVNLFAVLASVLSNLLFFAGGRYNLITPEVATHAIPLPVLGFCYGLLLHRTSAKAARVAAQQAAHAEAERRATEQAAREAAQEAAQRAKNTCRYCGAGFLSEPALRGHLGRCPDRPRPGA